jgi:nicotinamide-nucleotide amidase
LSKIFGERSVVVSVAGELKALMLRAPRRTLAVAESLTAGNVQARVASVAGASGYFLGGVTAYTLEQKVAWLGVDRAAAVAVNCVSAEIAAQMARGVSERFGAEVGVATTGYAEAALERGVPAPMAWWAVAIRDARGEFSVTTGRVDLPGCARVEVQSRVAEAALAALVAALRAERV